jgi:hypothetical protein
MGNVCICKRGRRSSRCEAHPGFVEKPFTPTPKQYVLLAEPKARSDYYESLRKAGRPCWFIRIGYQDRPLSAICASPRKAWANAHLGLLASIRLSASKRRQPKGGK